MDFLAGASAGALGNALTHPLDTLIVRFQANAGIRNGGSLFTTAREAAATGFTSGFLRGMCLTCSSAGLARGLAFGGSELTRAPLRNFFSSYRPHSKWHLEVSACSGLAGGFAASLIQAPVEFSKKRAQAQRPSQQLQLSSTLTADVSVARDVLFRDGPLGLYRGWRIFAAGCSLTYGAWFVFNDVLLSRLTEAGVRESNLSSFLCGGISGCAAKILHSPFDVTHTLYVTSASSARGYRTIIADEWREAGSGFLFCGLSLGIVRSFLRTGITMHAFKTTKAWMSEE
eukprot:TRINITY_DN79886_c0_g1_i1.p1 TRINITY_DN79886_c0_g1~~TRINITY_DN79886_c0_g1_i1.p1  ORF type:complete len:286 (+),score=46.29 TRINITY_DN79886_c0_g1_i1:59-916(+)